MITFKHEGDFKKSSTFLSRARRLSYQNILSRYGKAGVRALSEATPVDSGLTADSWSYETKITKSGISLTWTNSNVVDGTPIAILLQYGHATRNGGYVTGKDYINPALRSIFDKLAQEAWKEITSL